VAGVPFLQSVQNPLLPSLGTAIKPRPGLLRDPLEMCVRVIEGVFPAKLIEFLAPALQAGLSLRRKRNLSRSTECLHEPREHDEVGVARD
jgi:hypothetical protein